MFGLSLVQRDADIYPRFLIDLAKVARYLAQLSRSNLCVSSGFEKANAMQYAVQQ